MAGAGRTAAKIAAFGRIAGRASGRFRDALRTRRERGKERIEVGQPRRGAAKFLGASSAPHSGAAANHQAESSLQSPNAAAGLHVDKVQPGGREALRALYAVLVMGV